MATRRNTGRTDAQQEQVRQHRVSLFSLHPSPTPSVRAPSLVSLLPRSKQEEEEEELRRRGGKNRRAAAAADALALALALEPPTLDTYHTALRHHLIALLPTVLLIALLAWVASTYADLTRHHHHPREGRHQTHKPHLILVPLGAAAWLAAYAVRPLVWDLTDQLVKSIAWPLRWISRRWAAFRLRQLHRQHQRDQARGRVPRSSERSTHWWSLSSWSPWTRSRSHHSTDWEDDESEEGHAALHSPGAATTYITLVLSILFRTLILELLRIGSMALSIAILDAATRRGHVWMAGTGLIKMEELRLSPYDNRFGAVLWATAGWCSAEWLIGSYDVIRKLRLYHPSLWPSAIYAEPAEYHGGVHAGHSDENDEDERDDGYDEEIDDDEEAEDDDDADTIDRETALAHHRRRRQQARRPPNSAQGPAPSAPNPSSANAAAGGIVEATTAAQAAVHAVRFFPRVFTHTSTKSSTSSSAFTIRPGPVNVGGGGGGGSAFVLPSTTSTSSTAATSSSANVSAGLGGGSQQVISQRRKGSAKGPSPREAPRASGSAAGNGKAKGVAPPDDEEAGWTTHLLPKQHQPSRGGAEGGGSPAQDIQQPHNQSASSAMDSSISGVYGTFQTARTHFIPDTLATARGNESPVRGGQGIRVIDFSDGLHADNQLQGRGERGQGYHRDGHDLPDEGQGDGEEEGDANDNDDDHDDDEYTEDDELLEHHHDHDAAALPLDPEEEAELQGRLAHALAILLAARERADLEETLGARLDVQVGPALAALWRIDGFLWNLGECLLTAAAVAITSERWWSGEDGEDQGNDSVDDGLSRYVYETVPDLTKNPLLTTWILLTVLHTLLSLLWATGLPRLGFAPVSYLSLLLGMGLTVAGLAWWGVLI
ncbi:hypothetical protein V8E36_006703 [Tilletia maclaganii]